MGTPQSASHHRRRVNLPLCLVVVLIFSWALVGAWLIPRYPFLSGTDEALDYVAFSAAKNRWPTDNEIRRYRLSSAYYPPLYFLAFAPFWKDEPVFTDQFPLLAKEDTFAAGGYRYRYPDYDANKHALLDRLYRAAKYFSLALGVLTLAAVVATVRLASRAPARWWLCLLAIIPLVTLPQFLYYQTLENNDALCNALGALTIMCFAGAAGAVFRDETRAYVAWVSGLSFFFGLNLLTKTTSLIFLPLLPWAALGIFFSERYPTRERWLGFFKILALMLVVAAVSGGWWIVRNALQGDWNSQQLHRSLHPWAFTDLPYWEQRGWPNFLLATARSYVGLMANSYWGVSDVTFIVYSVMPLATGVVGLAWVVSRVSRSGAGGDRRFRPSASQWLIGGLALVVLSNVVGLLWLNREVTAFFGRLLFPSLAASHALAALLWGESLQRHRKALVAVVAASGILYGAAFLHVFRNWMFRAVAQPEEHVVPLSFPPVILLSDQITGHVYRQPFVLPPGRVGGVRVRLLATEAWPQLGGRIAGFLEVADPSGGAQRVPLEPVPLGDVGWTDRYAEFTLQRELTVTQQSKALLTLAPQPPIFPSQTPLRFLNCMQRDDRRIGDLEKDGVPLKRVNLCLAVFYND